MSPKNRLKRMFFHYIEKLASLPMERRIEKLHRDVVKNKITHDVFMSCLEKEIALENCNFLVKKILRNRSIRLNRVWKAAYLIAFE